MLCVDLAATGVEYVTEEANGPEYRDFHSLRHSYVAMLDRAGCTLKEAMQLARHSDPKLTIARYGKAQLHDLAGKVKLLPDLLNGTPSESNAQRLRATGTDGAATQPLPFSCSPVAKKIDTGGGSLITIENPSMGNGGGEDKQKPLAVQGVESDCEVTARPIMPLPFDATLKELVQAYAADWLAVLDQPSSEPVEILTPDLSTLTAFTDVVLRTGDSLLHLDFQSGPDPSLSRRVLLYNVLLN